jgi:Holliday junction resolvasome RuvABC endonuclease subunit
MIKKMLHIDKDITLDESDALGLAVCYLHRIKTSPGQFKNWKDFIKHHPELIQ